MDQHLLEILVCPLCKKDLILNKILHELICPVDKLAFAIYDEIPIMLIEHARQISDSELEALR